VLYASLEGLTVDGVELEVRGLEAVKKKTHVHPMRSRENTLYRSQGMGGPPLAAFKRPKSSFYSSSSSFQYHSLNQV